MRCLVKWGFVLMLMFGVLCSSYSQDPGSDVIKEEVLNLEEFKIESVQGIHYVKWNIIENEDKCLYVLEGSPDGKDFKTLIVKKGYKTPNDFVLSYYYKDDLSLFDTKYYRLKKISPDLSLQYSKVYGL